MFLVWFENSMLSGLTFIGKIPDEAGFPSWLLHITSQNKKIKLALIISFANGRCQSLLQSTRIGSTSLLIVDAKVYYSQQERIHTLC